MEKYELLPENIRPIDYPDHCQLGLQLATQLKSFQVQYPLFDKKYDSLVENIFLPIFNSAIEAYAYFESKEEVTHIEGWCKNRSRLVADFKKTPFNSWKKFWENSYTAVFVDKNQFNFEEFFGKCLDPGILGNPGSIYSKTAWNFARKKAATDHLVGFFITKTNFAEVGGVACEYISVIGSEKEIRKVFNLATQHCKISNIYERQRTFLKPGRFFKIFFDKKTCKELNKHLAKVYGGDIKAALKQNFRENGYGEIIGNTFYTGGNYINFAIYTQHIENGLKSIKKILKEKLLAPENTVIKEYTWPDTQYNYGFRLDEKWTFLHSTIIE